MNFFMTDSMKLWGKRLISSCIVIAMILVSLGPVFPVKRAEAIPTTVIGGLGTIQETISAGADTLMSSLQSSFNMKEFVLDGIAWTLINAIIHEISQSIITWINSGFQGSPSFVTDLGGFLTGVADKVAGEYIWNSGLSFLCSPFKLNIQIALDIQYRKARSNKVQCTLSGVLTNVTNFAEAPTNNWDSWFQVALKPENNAYGSMLLAQEKMSVSITNAQGKQIKLLEFGKGFFSKQKCEKVEGKEICKTVTPGTTIENQLNTALNLPAGRLQIADEINEILAALFAQLAKQAITGAGGLLGLTKQGSGGGQGSYFDQIRNSTTTAGYVSTGNPIEDSIMFEQQWRSLHQQGADLIEGARSYQENSCRAGDAFSSDLQSKLIDMRFAIMQASSTIESLTDMALDYTSASSTVKNAVMQEYLEMQMEEVVHNEATIYNFRMIDLPEIQTAVTSYKSSIEVACREL